VEILERLVRAVVEQYSEDPTSPSIVTSWLGSQWYVSVVRYAHPYAEGKLVVVNCIGSNLEKLYVDLLQLFSGSKNG
jgi:hypothetical protein